jgi:hypothetical protein
MKKNQTLFYGLIGLAAITAFPLMVRGGTWRLIPTKEDLAIATALGARVAQITKKLRG